MLIPLDEVIYFDAVTHDPDTGAIVDADSVPVFDVFEEATDAPIVSATAMTKRTSKTGNYRGTSTASLANGYEAGKWYSVVVSATVTGSVSAVAITAKKVALHFRVAPAEAVAGVPKGDAGYVAGQVITAAAGVTFPSSVASPTNITAAAGVVLSAAGVDAIYDEAMSGHTTAGTYGDKLRVNMTAALTVLFTSGSTTTSLVLNASTGIDGAAPSSTNDFYNGRVLVFITGTLAGQATDITDYVGSTKTLTVTALTSAPASGVVAVMV